MCRCRYTNANICHRNYSPEMEMKTKSFFPIELAKISVPYHLLVWINLLCERIPTLAVTLSLSDKHNTLWTKIKITGASKASNLQTIPKRGLQFTCFINLGSEWASFVLWGGQALQLNRNWANKRMQLWWEFKVMGKLSSFFNTSSNIKCRALFPISTCSNTPKDAKDFDY